MLRLGYQKSHCDNIEEYQTVVDLTDAYLVVETRTQIMDQSSEEQDDEEESI